MDRNPVPLDESFQITFRVEGGMQGQPDFSPLEQNFQVLGTSRSQQTRFIDGQVSHSVEYRVSAMARKTGTLTIPSIDFDGRRSPLLKIRVTPPGQSGRQPQVKVEAGVDITDPYVQQQVILTVRILRRVRWRDASLSQPGFPGGDVLVKKLGNDRTGTVTRDGVQWEVIERRYALFPQSSGPLRMEPFLLSVSVPSGQRRARDRSPFGDPFFDDFFSRMNYVHKVVRSNALTLQVKPVPAAFTGSHWLPARSVRLQAKWSAAPDHLEAGEPVTLTLTLTAEGISKGQLPDLTLPAVPGLRIYPDDPQARERITDRGVVTTLSRKFALIPERPGRYRLPEVQVPWWNLQTDRPAVARMPARTLEVTGSAVPASQESPPASPAPATSAPTRPVLPPASGALLQQPRAFRWLPHWATAPRLAILTGGLLLAWLVTLWAWWRARSRSVPASEERRTSACPPAIDPDRRWRALEQAAASGDPPALRDALLGVAPLLWPDAPPRSLEAMARCLEAPLRDQLLALSRQLYGGGKGGWDAERLARGIAALRRRKSRRQQEKPTALEPLYPKA